MQFDCICHRFDTFLPGNYLYCRWSPYGNTKCTICKQQVHQDGKYCHTCAYSKGNEEYLGIAYDLILMQF